MIAASVDTLDKAQETQMKHSILFPVAYGLNAIDIAEKTGAYYDAEKGYLHSTDFIIKPGGIISGAVYSTGPIGRYVAKDCLNLIDFYTKKAG